MIMSIDVSDAEAAAIKSYAHENSLSVQDFILHSVMEHIENERDRRDYEEAMAEYLTDPVTYTHEQVGQMLGMAK